MFDVCVYVNASVRMWRLEINVMYDSSPSALLEKKVSRIRNS